MNKNEPKVNLKIGQLIYIQTNWGKLDDHIFQPFVVVSETKNSFFLIRAEEYAPYSEKIKNIQSQTEEHLKFYNTPHISKRSGFSSFKAGCYLDRIFKLPYYTEDEYKDYYAEAIRQKAEDEKILSNLR